MRPLGLPSWSDKLVGEVVRILLEAYYEPRFSGRSHGFRPGRGCHTALSGGGARPGPGQPGSSRVTSPTASGRLDHEVMLSILAEHIHDNRFLRLIKGMLRAGYLEDWDGTRRFAVLRKAVWFPLSCPIFTWTGWTSSPRRSSSRNIPGEPQESQSCVRQGGQRDGGRPAARGPGHGPGAAPAAARPARRDPGDPGYRRLRYTRYADDHLLGFTGPKAEAEEIKQRLAGSCARTSSWNCRRTRR